jgi:hypothetical protein
MAQSDIPGMIGEDLESGLLLIPILIHCHAWAYVPLHNVSSLRNRIRFAHGITSLRVLPFFQTRHWITRRFRDACNELIIAYGRWRRVRKLY